MEETVDGLFNGHVINTHTVSLSLSLSSSSRQRLVSPDTVAAAVINSSLY